MNHYCAFKDINSLDLGLYIERFPEKISPSRRDQTIEISGRHGNLTVTDGSFGTYILQAEFIVKNEKNKLSNRNQVGDKHAFFLWRNLSHQARVRRSWYDHDGGLLGFCLE